MKHSKKEDPKPFSKDTKQGDIVKLPNGGHGVYFDSDLSTLKDALHGEAQPERPLWQSALAFALILMLFIAVIMVLIWIGGKVT